MVDIVRPVYGEAWASVGEKVSPTLTKIQGGWIQEMMPYQWENFLQNRQDTALLYMLQKGVPEWDASQEYIAGKSVVTYQTNLYISVLDSTNVLPTVQASWKRLNPLTSSSGVVTVAGGGTGASTATDARTNLGLGSIATSTAPASNGVVVRSAADTLISRSITGTANNIVVTNGDGVAGNISINTGSNVALLNTDSSWTSTGSIRLPSGSTSQQGTSTPGRVRFNLEADEFHGAYSDGWKVLARPASAEQTPIIDVGNFYTSSNVEGALQEVGLKASFVKDAILSYPDYAAAETAAATLPDGQVVDVEATHTRYTVSTGSLINPRQYTIGYALLTDFPSLKDALATGMRVRIPASISSISVAAADVPTVLDKFRFIEADGDVTISLPSGQLAIPNSISVRQSGSGKVKLVGADPVNTTITSIVSATGSAGNWSIVANVANATGISVGDVICVRNVKPGVQTPGTYTGRPQIGALQLGFFAAGSLSLNETSGSVTGTVLPTFVSSGDFLIADGQVKRMLTISESAFTVDATNAPPIAYSGKQYWYTMRSSSAGTITVSGTTVTGVGTGFTSRVNVGDILAIQTKSLRRVVSVDSDEQLTIEHGGVDVATGVVWGVIVPGETHEGAWVVSAVDGKQITWTNTSRLPYPPPVKLVNAGDVYCLKTNLVFSSKSAFIVDSGLLDIDKIGLRGSGGSATSAFDLRESGSSSAGRATLGTRMGVFGFHYGAYIPSGSVLQADATHWGGQFTRGIYAYGGDARIGSAVIAGTGGIGVFIGEGSYGRMADTRVHGCSLQGLRMEVGGSVWADFSIIGRNVSGGVLLVGGVNAHLVGMRCIGNYGSGVVGQNGGYGRATGATLLCNGRRGYDLTHSFMECNQSLVIGNAESGAVVTRARVSFDEGVFGGNAVVGIYALSTSDVTASANAQFYGNKTGILATSRSQVYAPASGYKQNATNDLNALTGGQVFATGASGVVSTSPVADQLQPNYSLISMS